MSKITDFIGGEKVDVFIGFPGDIHRTKISIRRCGTVIDILKTVTIRNELDRNVSTLWFFWERNDDNPFMIYDIPNTGIAQSLTITPKERCGNE